MDSNSFDSFLSHNSRDKPAVERIAILLKQEGITPWFDAWDLPAGGDWQDGIERGLRHSRGCAVFLGSSGFGDWQIQEMKVASSMAAHDPNFRYFLVLLPGAPDPLDPATLPAFINLRSRVNLREGFASTRQIRELISAILGLTRGPPDPIPPDLAESPYRGLEAFDEAHAEFFFGRAAEIQKLLAKLAAAPFLAVIGPSGSGKSSLVLAGLIPALRSGKQEGSADWLMTTLVPGAHPLESLAIALDALDPERSRHRRLEELRGSPLALRLEAGALLRNRPRSARLVLVVDQFEEIFTLCRDEQERQAFIGLLLAAAQPGSRCLVIITMRADFYPRITEYPALADQVASHQLLVGALTKEGLTAAIEQPAFRKGLQFEPGLVATILADAGGDAGALPLLQYALDELWKRQQGHLLTLEGYRASGGVGEAIATRANAVYEGLAPDEQAVARRVLLRLTQPGESTEDTRRRANRDELVTRPADRPAIEAAIDALVAARLLTTGRDEATGAAQVDVAHEALIRAWPRLRQWLDEDRQGLLAHRRLTDATHEWQRGERDADLLYRGARLSEALALAALQPDALNELERTFLAESEALRERERAAAITAAEARERLRRRILVGLVAFSVVALLLALLAGWQWREAGQQTVAARIAEATAQSETARAESEAGAARRAETVSLSRQLAVQSRDQGGAFDRAMLLAAEAYDLDPADLEGERALFGAVQAHPTLERLLSGHEGEVNTVAFSPDDQLLASGSDDGTIRLWDPITGHAYGDPIVTGQGKVSTLVFRPKEDRGQAGRDSWQLVSGSDSGAIQIWNVGADTSNPALQIDGDSSIGALAFSKDGARLATSDSDGTITIWNVVTGAVVTPAWKAHVGRVKALAFSPDGSVLVSAGLDDRKILIWTPGSSDSPGELPIDDGRTIAVMFNPAGNVLVSNHSDQVLRWDIVNRLPLGAALTGVGKTGMAVTALAMSGNGAVLAAGGDNSIVWQWDMASGVPIGEPLDTGQVSINGLALNEDGSQLATVGGSSDIRLWSSGLPKQGLFASVQGHLDFPQSMAISPDNTTIATGDIFGDIFLWDARDGSPIGGPLRGHADFIVALEFNHDGSLLASGSEDGTVQIWDARTGAKFAGPLGGGHDRDGIPALAFSPTGEWLAIGGYEGSVRMWKLTDSGVEAGALLNPMNIFAVSGLAFNPEGAILAAAMGDGQILLWDMNEQPLRETRIRPKGGSAFSLCFVDDGVIATGGAEGVIRFVSVTDGQEVEAAIATNDDFIFKLSCDPKHARLASSSLDGRGRLWNLGRSEHPEEQTVGAEAGTSALTAVLSADGSTFVYLSGNADNYAYVTVQQISGGAFSFPTSLMIQVATLNADASRVAVGGEDGLLGVWDAATGQQIAMGHADDGGRIWSVAFDAGSSHVASGSDDGSVRLWDSTSAELIEPVMRGLSSQSKAVAFNGTGELLAAGDEDGSLRLWDIASHQAIGDPLVNGNPPGTHDAIETLAFNENGSVLATGAGTEVTLWNVAEPEMAGAPLVGHTNQIYAIAFSPKTQIMASADRTGQIQLWDVTALRQAGPPLVGSQGAIRALAFSNDGTLLAAGNQQGAIAIWDVASRSELGLFNPGTSQIRTNETGPFVEPSPILSLVFSTDGSALSALDVAGIISHWNLAPAAWLQRACTVANRNLTLAEWRRFIGDPEDPRRPYHKTCAELPGPTDANPGTPAAAGAGAAAIATPVASGAAA